MVPKILLICGIASSVLYVASDILVSWWDPNYSYRDQSFSELLAPGSPTRPIMVMVNGITYGVLVAALFGATILLPMALDLVVLWAATTNWLQLAG